MKPTTGCSDTGPEFDRLKTIKEVSLNADLVAFVEKAHSSLQPEDALSNGIVTRDLSFITLPWGTWGRTPLSWTAEYGSLAVAKILLEQGANANALDYEGGSPLTWLIHAGNPEITSLEATEAYLRERGAKEARLSGIKLAWIWVLCYSRLLRYIRPRI
ncbi:Pc24g02430 [Penicillium rubens Wisconsin 54-1255]|uniref:Pc24g02430 protein n=1 Tax=Penicillium rubens (strain ATCC 28089 / DSM 1075 / NRRL 1951 / Wisconsin 54-1255) TaxID=500485 RepID=B6HX22_PENRW|nr:Pc24g02430 [Penicillium rubens Wisconsin 54-1255]